MRLYNLNYIHKQFPEFANMKLNLEIKNKNKV